MTILVTGATANIGRKVVDHLIDRGATDIRALTATPEQAALPDGVDVRTGFIGNTDSLDGVFDGVHRMYLAPHTETARQVCELAAAAGVGHIVDLSGPEDSWWGDVKRAVDASGIACTHLEPGEFTENLTIWAEQIRQTGQIRDAFAQSANTPITMADIAEVAAAILVSGDDDSVAPEHVGAEYLMGGPQLLTKADKVRAIADGLDREIPFIEVERAEAVELLRPSMGEYAQWYVGVAAETLDPGPEAMDVVPRITGRPATRAADWVRANAALFE